jgi:NitT/TauT family transport system substrate-binding protein
VFRRLDTPIVFEMLGQTLATRDDYLAENPDVLVGFARGVAKATLFGLTNPEAAVRIHWKLFPASKPQGGDDAKLMKDALHVFEARFALQRVDNREDKRYGAASTAQWQRFQNIFKEQRMLQGTVPASEVYTGALIDKINTFDRAAVIRQAKEYRP